MKFKLIEKYSDWDPDDVESVVHEYLYDAVNELKDAKLDVYWDWYVDNLSDYNIDPELIKTIVSDVYIEAIDCGKINRPKTMITSELTDYISANKHLVDTIDELINRCPDHLQYELKLVIDAANLNESLNEELLTESINTNLRKFLVSLLELYKNDWKTILQVSSVDAVVVHHINKDRTANSANDLALMSDHWHRSMHTKYSGDKWDPSVLSDHPHILVSELLPCVAKALIDQNQQDELSVNNN